MLKRIEQCIICGLDRGRRREKCARFRNSLSEGSNPVAPLVKTPGDQDSGSVGPQADSANTIAWPNGHGDWPGVRPQQNHVCNLNTRDDRDVKAAVRGEHDWPGI